MLACSTKSRWTSSAQPITALEAVPRAPRARCGASLWRWLRRHGAEFRTIVDSGANIGQTVLYFATLLPRARILAYEPGRAARQWLEEGVAANGLRQVAVHAAGLGASPQNAFLGNVVAGGLPTRT